MELNSLTNKTLFFLDPSNNPLNELRKKFGIFVEKTQEAGIKLFKSGFQIVLLIIAYIYKVNEQQFKEKYPL